jgi:glycosyltransferase involved in cell wall biosynthesis
MSADWCDVEPWPGRPGRLSSRPPTPRVSVVIPTLNEALNLPHVFAGLPRGLQEVIMVDGGSTDDTVNVARTLRPDVRIIRQDRRGKGNALACGFAAATGDILVTLDADGSADPAEIPRFVAALLDRADFAKGTRFSAGGGSSDITLVRSAGNLILNGLVNLLFRTRYTDLCYGFNAFWRHCLDHIVVDCDGFEVETLMNIRVARAGLRVAEVPSFENNRIHGSSNLRTFRDGGRVLQTILRERMRPAPVAPAPLPATQRATAAGVWSGGVTDLAARRNGDPARVGGAPPQRAARRAANIPDT